jgi:UDP-glucuronate 4-epimerase
MGLTGRKFLKKQGEKKIMSKILVTGSAGFIGFHLVNALLEQREEVVGLDNINTYYDPELKYARLYEAGIEKSEVARDKFVQSKKFPAYRFIRMNLENKNSLMSLFGAERFDIVINLAAQAGVRYSIDNPEVYIKSNIIGFFNILEACRYYPVKYLLYASSSSVYGNNIKVPFSEDDNVDHPISLYAVTKKSNELMAHAYNHLYKVKSTGLRFFTVYGPWGRPDMAVFKFTNAIANKEIIQVFGEGLLQRDFTYIDDIITGIMSVLNKKRSENPPELLNIGNNKPVSINALISEIEKCLNIKAIVEYLPIQPGDVKATFANIDNIRAYCHFIPQTDLRTGIRNFFDWYLSYMTTKKKNLES